MKWTAVGRVHATVHSADEPTTDEWRGYLAHLQEHLPQIRHVLVYTAGGRPTAGMRAELRKVYEEAGYTPRIAVVTHSQIARGVVTALRFFLGEQIRAFDPADLNAALAYLELRSEHQQTLLGTLHRFCEELGVRSPID